MYIYDWNIVDLDAKQPINLNLKILKLLWPKCYSTICNDNLETTDLNVRQIFQIPGCAHLDCWSAKPANSCTAQGNRGGHLHRRPFRATKVDIYTGDSSGQQRWTFTQETPQGNKGGHLHRRCPPWLLTCLAGIYIYMYTSEQQRWTFTQETPQGNKGGHLHRRPPGQQRWTFTQETPQGNKGGHLHRRRKNGN